MLLVGLLLLLLAGCSNDDSKQVISISIRSNRVSAQQANAPRNLYTAAAQPTPRPIHLRPTPTASPVRVALAMPTPERMRLVPTATPPLVPLGRPERIVIPSAGIDTSIQSVYPQPSQIGAQWFRNWSTAAFSAGYHESSALLGQPGNTVISGHNNIDGAVFQNLYQLQPGDSFQLYANGFRYDYIVEDQFIVREGDVPVEQRLQNASWIGTTIDERVTLVSCWPPESNSHRVIVVARPNRGQP